MTTPYADIERLASLAGEWPAAERAMVAVEAVQRFLAPTLTEAWAVVPVDVALEAIVREALADVGGEVRVVDGTMEARRV